jgi:hypothetical protein
MKFLGFNSKIYLSLANINRLLEYIEGTKTGEEVKTKSRENKFNRK